MDGAEVWQRIGTWGLLLIPIGMIAVPGGLAVPLVLVGATVISAVAMIVALCLVQFAGHDLSRPRIGIATAFCGIAATIGIFFGVNATPFWTAGMAFGYSVAGVMGTSFAIGIRAYQEA